MHSVLILSFKKMEIAVAASRSFNTVCNREDREREKDIPDAVLYGTIRGLVEIPSTCPTQVRSTFKYLYIIDTLRSYIEFV